MKQQPPDPKANRLLSALEPADYDALIRRTKLVAFKFRKRLYRQDAAIDAVYFPITCMISLLVADRHGKPQMCMATVGTDGALGASEVLQGQVAMGLTIVQLPGSAVRIGAEDFAGLLAARPGMTRVINRYTYALMRQILYGAACNQQHSMEQRCARWLLMTRDRAGTATFRATVNLATGALKKAGLIRYVRGIITIVDQKGLEAAACICYREIARVYDSVIPSHPAAMAEPPLRDPVNAPRANDPEVVALLKEA
jgi:CRP-like cAMP-binding protein